MKKDSSVVWLSTLYGLSVLGLFYVLTVYLSNSRTSMYCQSVAADHQKNLIAYQLIVSESVQYAQKNPAIDPILASIGLVRNSSAPASVPTPASNHR